ncbi:HlyU family transcriptional regulator [Halomonas binhaiensis]|uniref:Uncharacterized protein n=1 Tax=Halomonas binhaiensis TaxID=2562282 RepID=A0A5C1NFH2_9GAMM|nr:HlyU family transcriptional regulator [Halomonas binhaiensis]QEM81620.1 hypothetical protein E4T21_08730 [Halomonas binhaiensis]
MLKKLLGGLFKGGEHHSENETTGTEYEYRGYLITSLPQQQGGQYRVSGIIRKSAGDGEFEEAFEYRFERSDILSTRDACDELMRQKAERFIDEIGDDMFSER